MQVVRVRSLHGAGHEPEYPWGSTPPGTGNQYAIYGCYYSTVAGYPPGTCTGVANIAPVGTTLLGGGLWGQLDLAGDLWEWNLDWWFADALDPCTDCADLEEPGVYPRRVISGGFFGELFSPSLPPPTSQPLPSFRDSAPPVEPH
jgi:formylglycine-generating enzyme required for sulfatase activity